MNTDPITVYAWRNEPQSDLRSLTAASLLGKIELAEGGDTRELFALYRDLLASDNQLQMEFENRKRAVEGDTSTLLPFDKSSPPDVEAKDRCFPLLDSAPFYTAKTWLLNAVLYPVAVCEKVYAPAPGGYALAQIVPVPYQLLDYREGTLRIFDTDERGNALPTSHAPDPARYVVHRGHTLPLPDNWGGPMRAILFWILLRSMSRQWWADLLERFGMPFLKGKYSDEKGKTVLQRAFVIAQRLGGIVVHKNTEVEIVQAAAGDSSGSHERFIELCNKEISKLVAGQTLSSNAQPTGLGNGATPLQGAVRDDIRKSDCQRLAATLRTQLLAQFCQINAVPGRVPLLVFGSDSAAEMKALIGTVADLAAAGLEPDDDGLAALSERVGFGLRRKAAPAASPGFPAAFHAVPLAADPAAGKPREAPADKAGVVQGAAPSAPDPLAEIVRTSRSSTECLRRLREALATRPLDEQAEELAAAMDSYAAKALLRTRRSPDGEAPPSTIPLSANWHKCPHCGKFDGFNGHCGKCGHTLSESEAIRRAREMLSDAMSGTMLKPVNGIAYREQLGQIDLEVGRKGVGKGMEHGTGLSKLEQKHAKDIPALAEALIKGAILQTTAGTQVGNPVDPDRRCIAHGSYAIYLARKGERRWKVSTIFQSEAEIRKAHQIAEEIKSRK
ncbi:MAG: DUF935 family protein [Kiritimatiellae bacterium]|nr:DUF935 family protein [Kiritimatiellia bacterium]